MRKRKITYGYSGFGDITKTGTAAYLWGLVLTLIGLLVLTLTFSVLI